MAATTQSRPDCVSVANQTFADVFNNGPYTSLKMVEYLIVKCRASYVDYVTNPKILERVSPKDIAQDSMNHGLFYTWGSRTGRCTSFALKVVAELERMYPGYFEFMFYDLKGHRVARCCRTGILIDSSSYPGAFQLQKDNWIRVEEMDASWKWVNGKSKFERIEERKGEKITITKISTETISPLHAMSLCLTDVAAKKAALTLFRSYENGHTSYYGLISWNFKKKCLEMNQKSGPRKIEKFLVVWGQRGNESDNTECLYTVNFFVKNYGGPLGVEQWQADGIERIHLGIWAAANNAWGFPVLRAM